MGTGRTPIGVIAVCLLVVLYGGFWLLTGVLAVVAANGPVLLLSLVVGLAVLGLAGGLYDGSPVAWWVAVVVFGASTVWRLSRVAGGAAGDLTNAVVGAVVVGYLLWRRDFFGEVRP